MEMSLTVMSEQEAAIKANSNYKVQGPNSHRIFSSSSSDSRQNCWKILCEKALSVVMSALITSGKSCFPPKQSNTSNPAKYR